MTKVLTTQAKGSILLLITFAVLFSFFGGWGYSESSPRAILALKVSLVTFVLGLFPYAYYTFRYDSPSRVGYRLALLMICWWVAISLSLWLWSGYLGLESIRSIIDLPKILTLVLWAAFCNTVILVLLVISEISRFAGFWDLSFLRKAGYVSVSSVAITISFLGFAAYVLRL